MSVILDEVFAMVLESSQLRKDGCNFSRFDSISKVMEKVHVKLLNGRIINHNDIYWFDHSTIDFNTDEHARLWYQKDINLLIGSKNVLDQLP
jgi:hypothetical protein